MLVTQASASASADTTTRASTADASTAAAADASTAAGDSACWMHRGVLQHGEKPNGRRQVLERPAYLRVVLRRAAELAAAA